jgi:hypothetical protein
MKHFLGLRPLLIFPKSKKTPKTPRKWWKPRTDLAFSLLAI